MVKDNTKKAKWISTITFTNGMDIRQRIYSQDLVTFIRNKGLVMHLDLDRIHSYVFPYILNEAKKQTFEVRKIEIIRLEDERN